MKVKQLINANGNPAPNQFVITDGEKQTFQSYETKIAEVERGQVALDSGALNYSKTTSKHLFIFLGMDRKQIEKAIKAGTITVKNLNN
jgi:hypothetical protein